MLETIKIGFKAATEDFEIMLDNIRRTFNDPGQNGTASVPEKKVAVILDVARAFDLRVERDDDQPPPDARILGTDLGKMIGIKHNCMAGRIGEGVLVLFLRRHIIRGAELFYDGRVQPGAFLQLGSDQHPFSLGFSQFRAHITLAAHGQGVGGNIPAVRAQHMSQGIPEGGFSVSPVAISNDERFHEHFSHSNQTGNLLHVVNQLLVAAEEQLQGIFP